MRQQEQEQRISGYLQMSDPKAGQVEVIPSNTGNTGEQEIQEFNVESQQLKDGEEDNDNSLGRV